MYKFTQIQSTLSLRNNITDIPASAGVYKQYMDKVGLKLLEDVHPTTTEIVNGEEIFLLYIGRTKNLRERFKSHLGLTNVSEGSITRGFISTLRVSYMANHKDISSLSQQEKLNEFMDKHIYIQYMVTNDFIAVEEQLINENDLPLNIKGNKHPFVKINKARRKVIKDLYRNTK